MRTDLLLMNTAVEAVPNGLYQSVSVKTDSRGRASIFLVLGSMEKDYGVTVGLTETTLYTFEAEAGEGKDASSIAIVSGDGQRADQYGDIEDPLVVVVRDQRGRRLTNAIVTFVALDGGELEFPEGDEPGGQRIDNGNGLLGNNTVTAKVAVTQPIPSRFRHRVPPVRLVKQKRLLFQSPLGSGSH